MNKRIRLISFLWLLLFITASISANAGELFGSHYYEDGGCWGDKYLFPGETLTLEMDENVAYVFNSGRAHLANHQWWSENDGCTILEPNATSFDSCTIWGLKPASNQKVKLYLSYTIYSDGYSATKYTMYYFNVTVKTPTNGYITLSATPEGGAVDEGTVVKLSTNVSGADIYYTTNGYYPTPYDTKYTSSGITINSNTTLKARAMKSGGYYMSDVLEIKYILKVPVNSITLNASSVDLMVGGTKQLTATVKPSNATDKTVTWSSENTSVATVNSSGLVTAVSAGSATITCTANDGSGVNAKCVVSVSSGGVAINATNFPDDNFRNFLLNYSLGRDGVLTDSEIGEIKTLYLNGLNIASLKGIEYFTSLAYLKCENNQLTSLDLSNNTALLTVYCQRNKIRDEGMDEFINSLPQHTGWRSVYLIDNTQNDEENVCTKSQATKARNKMWRLYSCDSSNSWKEYSGSEDPNPKPDNIVLPAEATVTAGQTITLTPTVTPANAEYTLTWSSDDETIATVNQNGVVTGVKKGKTFINVETDNGKTAYCKLTVTAPEPISIELPKNVTITVGGILTLQPTITPNDAQTTLTWKSDDVSVVRVDANGVLTGVAEGLALVTVSTSNGLTSNACKVIVEPDPSGISTVMMDEKAGAPIYTPSGQRLAAPRKGVNIIGGKKVVIK